MKEEVEFKVGDRVEGIGIYMGRDVDNKKGKVVKVLKNSFLHYCGVEWDEEIFNGHDCRGKAKNGHGWDVPINQLKKISKSKSKYVKQLNFE